MRNKPVLLKTVSIPYLVYMCIIRKQICRTHCKQVLSTGTINRCCQQVHLLCLMALLQCPIILWFM